MEEKEVTTSGQEKERTDQQKTRKPSYEELVNIINQLNQQAQNLARQNDDLKRQLQQASGTEARLFYLFKILECRTAFDSDFIIEVSDEIKDIMTIKDEQPEKEDKEA